KILVSKGPSWRRKSWHETPPTRDLPFTRERSVSPADGCRGFSMRWHWPTDPPLAANHAAARLTPTSNGHDAATLLIKDDPDRSNDALPENTPRSTARA